MVTVFGFMSAFDIKSLLLGFDIKSIVSGSAVCGSVGWVAGKWLERRSSRRASARKACERLRMTMAAWYSAIADATDEENTAVQTENKLKKLWRKQYYEPAIQNCIDDMEHVRASRTGSCVPTGCCQWALDLELDVDR